jgi:hypothetical protein
MEHGEHREVIELDHPHAFDPSEPKGGFIVLFAVATVITLLLTVAAIVYYFDYAHEEAVYENVLAPPGEQLRELRAKEDGQLYTYGYIEREKGAVRVPIDRAMELTIQEAAAGKYSYPTAPTHVKTAEELAAAAAGTVPPVAGGSAAAQGPPVGTSSGPNTGQAPAAKPQGNTTNATPAPPAK